MSIKAFVFSAVAAAVMVGASAASAKSVVQTQSGTTTFSAFDGNYSQSATFAPGNLLETFNAFNTALGTLNSVDVSWVITLDANVLTGPNNGGGGLDAYNTGNAAYSVSTAAYEGNGLHLGVNGGESARLINSAFIKSQREFVMPNDYSYDPVISNTFAGSSPISLTYGGNFAFSSYGIASGSVDVRHTTVLTYNYSTPAVPEPETYALLLAGLGALGFVARRRKAL